VADREESGLYSPSFRVVLAVIEIGTKKENIQLSGVMMNSFRIRPISEEDINEVIESAGGRRAHEDADRRDKRGADYLLGNTVIELKGLDDNGLEKPERQVKLATLFKKHWPNRPVIVLDRNALPEVAIREYDRILEGPIKTAVRSANAQLKQSRLEILTAETSVLWVINNGYTAIDHDELIKLISNRVRNDTSDIDGVVVSGCYFHSDSFDSFFLWPITYITINLNKPFCMFDKLKLAWDDLANKRMTELMHLAPDKLSIKGPVVDTEFEIEGVMYVKPAPPIGKKSDFFSQGRPRKDSSGLDTCPPVATTFGDLSLQEWTLFSQAVLPSQWLGESYNEWLKRRNHVALTCSLQPFVSFPITWNDWTKWADSQSPDQDLSIHYFANDLFSQKIEELYRGSFERTIDTPLVSRYILVVTEEIGQDRANDISHIAEMSDLEEDLIVEEILIDKRMFHEYALMVACAYALAKKIDCVMWQKNLNYSWS
jgi:hypothetical protein